MIKFIAYIIDVVFNPIIWTNLTTMPKALKMSLNKMGKINETRNKTRDLI